MPRTISIRFYEELNDFLPPQRRKITFSHTFMGTPAIKDVIEAIGIPHTEVDMILVNGESVGFGYRPDEGDRVSVYPVFESLDISGVSHLRPNPLRIIRFIVDVHLGKLARYLRMLGFDTLYRNDYEDNQIISIAAAEKRIILTRDIGILKNNAVTHGYWIRSQIPLEQLKEVVRRFDLIRNQYPVMRCMECNSVIEVAEKDHIAHRLKERTRQYFNEFFVCPGCRRIYWKGSHFERMLKMIERLRNDRQDGSIY
ncbi:MAG: Mut7-C ubiquitin/RNAse domain-containing protein [Bacteroidales bacterium]|nr:Mut7-C ubiquitin/RNAse domain-containing protein [Bacteroidales bacterium]